MAATSNNTPLLFLLVLLIITFFFTFPCTAQHVSGRDGAVPMISREAGSLPPIYARRLENWQPFNKPPDHPAGPGAPGT